MTSIVLGPILSRRLHRADWDRPDGNYDYRVTNRFDGPDYVNGGKHRATDVGNFLMNEPLKTPARCRARGRRHSDGALGVEMDLGGGVEISLWHLNRLDVPTDRWVDLVSGIRVGLTGNTGARISDGKGGTMPMPAHTHIAAERNGVPFDVEPHLFGAPLTISRTDDMKLSGKFLRHVQNRSGVLTDNAKFRAGVVAGANEELATLPKGTLLYPIVVVEGIAAGTARDRLEWYGALAWISGIGYVLGYVHSSLWPRTADRQGVVLTPIDAADCTALETKIRRARTAVAGAAQAIEAAKDTLS